MNSFQKTFLKLNYWWMVAENLFLESNAKLFSIDESRSHSYMYRTLSTTRSIRKEKPMHIQKRKKKNYQLQHLKKQVNITQIENQKGG